jgi:hypothetical protein
MALIRRGKLCKECSGKQCRDLGTDATPIEIECPNCAGHGCEHCNDGQFRVNGCPESYCRELIPVLEMFDFFDKGMMPISGGVLDQAEWFLGAMRTLQQEDALAKSE